MATPELNKALAAVQADLPPIAKGETGHVKGVTKQGEPFSYDYSYADLADVSEVILPLLGKHGLAYTAAPGTDENGKLVLDYALLHESGEERTGQFPLWLLVPDRARAQDIGGLLTYFRRYCLCAVTGVAPKGEDDDAAEVSKQKPARARRAKTAHDDPEHRALVRPTTAERARPADRTKGPVPEEDNLWQDQVPPPGAGAKGRIPAIQMHFDRLLGKDHDRSVRLGYIAALTGHAVTTSNDLTEDEQKQLLEALSKFRNRDALDKRAGEKEVPS